MSEIRFEIASESAIVKSAAPDGWTHEQTSDAISKSINGGSALRLELEHDNPVIKKMTMIFNGAKIVHARVLWEHSDETV
jgi:hypothetical protein